MLRVLTCMDQEHQTYLIETGRMFGYPPCCIESFVQRVRDVRRFGPRSPDPIQSAISHHSGFIPCLVCAKRFQAESIITRIKRVQATLRGRTFPLPFPHDIGTLFRALTGKDTWREDPFLSKAHKTGISLYVELLHRRASVAVFVDQHPPMRRFIRQLAEQGLLAEKWPELEPLREQLLEELGDGGIEPPTSGFGVRRSTN